MLSEFVTEVLADFAARAGASMFGALTAPRPLRDAIATSESYAMPDESESAIAGVLTRNQLEDIRYFLGTREASTLVQAMFLIKVAGGAEHINQRQALHDLRVVFQNLAALWCQKNNQDWESLSGDIWQHLVDFYDSVFPSRDSVLDLSPRDRVRLESYMGEPEQLRGNESPVPIFVRELIEITASQDRLIAARNRVEDLRNVLSTSFSRLRLRHAQEDYKFDFDQLYIDRSLTRQSNSMQEKSDSILDFRKSKLRCVIIGDPGVGKSTLVEHLIHTTTREPYSAKAIAPLLLRCRDYAARSGSVSLVEALAGTISQDLQLETKTEDLVDVLRLGRALVIFDGVDEIIDITRRREFIRQAEIFSCRFPFASIVITSRRVGYERASFDEDLFDVYELQEYSQAQVHQYADQWFRATERPQEDRDAFLRESKKIEDIRTNPLMLSLLCTLYRARGHIPRNRREVYRECADLLFHRWDSLRHIEQPIDHQQYGQHLMQELAFFFFQSQTAQGGVEERQLRRIIENFFIDTAGVFRDTARARASDFLDFCADRAWLLTSMGTNDHGQRLFTFTHRTFMEYFSAEVLVRRANSLQEIAEKVAETFRKDSSSVLPDIIVQCADDKFDRGAEYLIAHLIKVGDSREKRLALCLRLINSAPVSARLADSLFNEVFAHWRDTAANGTFESTIAVFELYRDPRERLLARVRGHRDTGHYLESELLCARWLRLGHTNRSRPFESEWGGGMRGLLDQIARDGPSIDDPAINDYLIAEHELDPGLLVTRRSNMSSLLAFRAFDTVVIGPIIGCLFRALTGTDSETDDALLEVVAGKVNNVRVPGEFVDFVGNTIREHIPGVVHADVFRKALLIDRKVKMSPVLILCLWVSFLLYERSGKIHEFHKVLDDILGGDVFRRMVITRHGSLGQSISSIVRMRIGPPYLTEEMRSVLPGAPSWCLDWCFGRISLIGIAGPGGPRPSL